MQETARNQLSAEFHKQWFYFIAEMNLGINDIPFLDLESR